MPNPGLRQQPRGILGGVTVQTSDVNLDLKTVHWCIPISFETGGNASIKFYVQQQTQISFANVEVFKALAGTDAGSITLYDSSGNSKASWSIPASTVINTDAGNGGLTPWTVNAGDFFRVNFSKSTSGGWAYLQLIGVRNGNG